MNRFEIAKLRVIAAGLDMDKRHLIHQALDTIENQKREIEALKEICEKQAEMNGRIAAIALELDEAKAEIQRLNKENFWLTNGGRDG